MDKPVSNPSIPQETHEAQKSFVRFDLLQRSEHLIFLLSFSLLGITGLPQKYADSPLSQAILNAFGGIETTRLVHHSSAAVMMVVSIIHVIEALYRVYVLRVPWSMMPLVSDFKHLLEDVGYFLGLRKHRASYGRYSYAEKVEYLAVVWGTVIMAITGFVMWNPIATTRYLPGQIIPAAKAAHGGEAILAVLAIIIWHFYHVHLRHLNKSMFTGKLTRQEMLHEHPAELAQIEAGKAWNAPDERILKKRKLVFFPAAAVIALVFSLGIYQFVFAEQTAITTIPQGETAEVFVPVTPTPRPTLAPTPTAALGEGVAAESWEGKYQALFRNRCGTCHGVTAVGGLSLATYQSALKGGKSGPAIIPGDPDASLLVQIQSAGNHPGQLTIDELNQVIQWILAGAPER